MFPLKCKAILKTMRDDVLEIGHAVFSSQNQSIDFIASFVPILQMDTEVKVICSEDDITTHIFTGKVYLSSEKLLRVVSLKCVFIKGAEKLLAAHAPFEAQVLLPAFKHKLIFNKLTYKWHPCNIRAISIRGLAIECPEILSEYEEKITVRISEPIFSKPTDIRLHTGQKGLMFGNHTKYKYKLGKLSKRAETELLIFIRQFNLSLLGNIDMIDESTIY
ncbi:MAG: hypothetical protein J6A58_01960 [Oscillospiraceae bacterium]|nr:hypothetical protein [Oscillospiraceae bacterium]